MNASTSIVTKALKTQQGNGVDVFAFFLYGSDITRVADISRINRIDGETLRGFQRKEIRNHVNAIIDFLDSGSVLFPNAIILAISPEVEFKQSRGPSPSGMLNIAQSGTLTIPIHPEGNRIAWIVDGQQRSLALAKAKNSQIPIPVIAFISSDLDIQREQFILINKSKPLPTRLINELLPEISAKLPRDLAMKQLPSSLCNLLNHDPKSPFYQLIRRESEADLTRAVIIDTAIIEAIKENLKSPMGALNQFKGTNTSDTDAMYRTLVLYWSTIRRAFPDAWGKSPNESRLMHSAGIRAMGALMDQIMMRADSSTSPDAEIEESISRLVPHCCWIDGTWENLGWRWNEIQSTKSHISKLTEYLIRLDRELSRPIR